MNLTPEYEMMQGQFKWVIVHSHFWKKQAAFKY